MKTDDALPPLPGDATEALRFRKVLANPRPSMASAAQSSRNPAAVSASLKKPPPLNRSNRPPLPIPALLSPGAGYWACFASRRRSGSSFSSPIGARSVSALVQYSRSGWVDLKTLTAVAPATRLVDSADCHRVLHLIFTLPGYPVSALPRPEERPGPVEPESSSVCFFHPCGRLPKSASRWARPSAEPPPNQQSLAMQGRTRPVR